MGSAFPAAELEEAQIAIHRGGPATAQDLAEYQTALDKTKKLAEAYAPLADKGTEANA